MKKLAFAILFVVSFQNVNAQTKTTQAQSKIEKPEYFMLASTLIMSFNQIQDLVNNNPDSEISRYLNGKLRNNIYSMDQAMNFHKDGLLKKLGEKDFAELERQIKNYSEIIDKKEPLNGDQFQSANLWFKLSSKKVDEIVLKLMK